jgi:FAD synthetase
MQPIITYKDLLQEKPSLGSNIVLVGGCFDILHIGHVEFLSISKQQGDTLVVALESNEFITERKKQQIVHTQRERAAILQSLRSVDYVILLPLMQGKDDYEKLVKAVAPSCISYTQGDGQKENKNIFAKLIGAKVFEFMQVTNKSSRLIRDRVMAFE